MTDLISRADAIELLTKIIFDEPPYLDSETLCRIYAEEQINTLPSADRPHGEWNRHELFENPWYTCSVCNYHGRNDFNFCPNCGADMRGEDE